MNSILCQNAKEHGTSLGEASEPEGISFGDMAKTAGAAAVGSLVVGLGMKAGEKLFFDKKPVEGNEDGNVTIHTDTVDFTFSSSGAEEMAEKLKAGAEEAKKKAEEKAKKEKEEKAKKKDEKKDEEKAKKDAA